MNFRLILSILPILFFSACYQNSNNKKAASITQLKTPATPHDFMLYERTYPYEAFDYQAYQQAVYQAKEHAMYKSNISAASSWVEEGPGNIGGRFNCTAVHPTNQNIIYAGAAQGGIFKTTNSGSTWSPIFDNQPFLSIGCISLNPQNPNTVWAGTGDVNISSFCYIGDGIYKSNDGGNTWTHKGLTNEHIISQIIVDPTDSNTIYAATMGQPFQRDTARGLYKSIDGGNTWNKILYINNETGITDIVMNPSNNQILYAAAFTRIRTYTESKFYSNDGKIWKTTDGGNNWTMLTGGLPNYPVSRIGLAISANNPNLLYAVITDSTLNVDGVYKTTNAGSNWSVLNNIDTLNNKNIYGGFGWYFGKVYINPGNDNQIYIPGVELYTTLNNGTNWTRAMPPWYTYQVHADQHWMSFINSNTIIMSTDGGIYKTTNNCGLWTDIEDIPVTQYYRVSADGLFPGDYWGGAQDNGTMSGNNSAFNSWIRQWGGDGFKSYIDPNVTGAFYAEVQWGKIYHSDPSLGPYIFSNGIDTNDRVHWNTPYLMSPHDASTFYYGSNKLYVQYFSPYGIWDSISSDLTKGWTGADVWWAHTTTCLDESPINAGNLFVGTADGNVQYTPDTGNTWVNITGTLPNRYVTSVKASPNVAGNVYVSHSGYRIADNTPHIHMSANNGTTWTSIAGNLPQVAINDILIYPSFEHIIFAATDVGVYFTTDAGATWARLGNNMPMVPVFDIELDATSNKLIAGTFARSMWSMDLSFILSIKENKSDFNIIIYPNPASDLISISFEKENLNTTIAVYDINGKEVKSVVYNNTNKIWVDVSSLETGTYFINIISDNKSSTKKFIKI